MSKLRPHTLSPEDFTLLRHAKHEMENISWAIRGLNQLGNVIEYGIQKIPDKQQKWIQSTTQQILLKLLKSNLLTMKKGKTYSVSSTKTYRALVTSSGLLGGAFGAPAFAADLAITTKLMMRSILDIARSEGEDIHSFDTQLACMQVFALGGKSTHDDNVETTYYATRIALHTTLRSASSYLAKHGSTQLIEHVLVTSGNPILKFMGQIAARYSIQVSEKFAAQAIPVAGAIGGGSINFFFLQHFQRMAKAHFSIRRLERTYGQSLVQTTFESIPTHSPSKA